MSSQVSSCAYFHNLPQKELVFFISCSLLSNFHRLYCCYYQLHHCLLTNYCLHKCPNYALSSLLFILHFTCTLTTRLIWWIATVSLRYMVSIGWMARFKPPDDFCHQTGIFTNLSNTGCVRDISLEDKLLLANEKFVHLLDCEFLSTLFTIKILKRSLRLHKRYCFWRNVFYC